MSKVLRINSNTEKILKELKIKIEEYYKSKTGMEIEMKEDIIIRTALINELEKINKLI